VILAGTAYLDPASTAGGKGVTEPSRLGEDVGRGFESNQACGP
jgi:hypothetical protein